MATVSTMQSKKGETSSVLMLTKGRPQSPVLPHDWSGLKVLLAALLILISLTGGAGTTQRARAAGAAGIVVRHSDGRILYAYVPLTSDRLTGAEALQKSGLALNVAVGGSFGTAVCAIDGEGCTSPQEDCFCKSYGSPSFYWHYYLRNSDSSWRNSNLGAGNRVLHDGDVDGWSWTSGDNDLPTVTLAQIAAALQPTAAPPTSSLAPTLVATDAPTTGPTPVVSAATATTDSQPRIAAIAPNGSATPIVAAPKPSSAPKSRAIGGFVAVVAVMLALLAIVPLGARRRRNEGRKERQ